MSRMLEALRRIETKTAALAEQFETPPAQQGEPAGPGEVEKRAGAAVQGMEQSIGALRAQDAQARLQPDSPSALSPAEPAAPSTESADHTESAAHTRPAVHTSSLLAAACEKLAQNILAGLPVERTGAVLFADAGHGEARTELLAELLPVLARQADAELVVVDADLECAELTARLGVLAVRGVPQVLLRACAWQEVVRPTCHAGVSLLPGVAFADPEGRLRRAYRWERLLADLRRRFGLIVVDGGSLCRTQVIPAAQWCDAAYLLVTLENTPYREASQAAAALRRQGARIAGCIAVGEAAVGEVAAEPAG